MTRGRAHAQWRARAEAPTSRAAAMSPCNFERSHHGWLVDQSHGSVGGTRELSQECSDVLSGAACDRVCRRRAVCDAVAEVGS